MQAFLFSAGVQLGLGLASTLNLALMATVPVKYDNITFPSRASHLGFRCSSVLLPAACARTKIGTRIPTIPRPDAGESQALDLSPTPRAKSGAPSPKLQNYTLISEGQTPNPEPWLRRQVSEMPVPHVLFAVFFFLLVLIFQLMNSVERVRRLMRSYASLLPQHKMLAMAKEVSASALSDI
jgi:hypothetical protein